MKNLSLKRSIFFAVCFSFSAISFNSGCETTDYEPLIMKKKLQEMEREISELKAAVKGASAAPVAPEVPAPPAVTPPPAAESEASESSDVSAAAPGGGSGVPQIQMNPPGDQAAVGGSSAKPKVPKDVPKDFEFTDDIKRASATIGPEALLSSIKSAGGYVETGDDGAIKMVDLSETSDFTSLLPRLASVPTLSHLSHQRSGD